MRHKARTTVAQVIVCHLSLSDPETYTSGRDESEHFSPLISPMGLAEIVLATASSPAALFISLLLLARIAVDGTMRIWSGACKAAN